MTALAWPPRIGPSWFIAKKTEPTTKATVTVFFRFVGRVTTAIASRPVLQLMLATLGRSGQRYLGYGTDLLAFQHPTASGQLHPRRHPELDVSVGKMGLHGAVADV